jgi:hypothetical protein
MHDEYSDTLCSDLNEKCGAWNITDVYFDGCILKEYCELDSGVEYEGIPVAFRCPNGKTGPDHGHNRFAHLFNLNDLVRSEKYSETIVVHAMEDILIEGEETHGTIYRWDFGGTDCEDQVIVGAVHKNQITKKREFPFTMVADAKKGSSCAVNFVFKAINKPNPDNPASDVKKIIF